MQEIQSMCVPQNIKKVRNFWKSNLDSPVPTESPKVTKRSCSVDSADGSNKKYKPQLFPKPSLPKQVKDKALYIPLQFIWLLKIPISSETPYCKTHCPLFQYLTRHHSSPGTTFSTTSPASLKNTPSPEINPCHVTPTQNCPDSSAPDSSAPDSSAPDSSAPDSSAPDSSAPDSSAPVLRIEVDDIPSACNHNIPHNIPLDRFAAGRLSPVSPGKWAWTLN